MAQKATKSPSPPWTRTTPARLGPIPSVRPVGVRGARSPPSATDAIREHARVHPVEHFCRTERSRSGRPPPPQQRRCDKSGGSSVLLGIHCAERPARCPPCHQEGCCFVRSGCGVSADHVVCPRTGAARDDASVGIGSAHAIRVGMRRACGQIDPGGVSALGRAARAYQSRVGS